jgi:hypothetical protein
VSVPREELEQIREALNVATIHYSDHPKVIAALALLDARLAQPEVREWRVSHNGRRRNGDKLRSREDCERWVSGWAHAFPGAVIQSRVPAGEWRDEQ